MSLYLESTHDQQLDNKFHFSNSVYVICQSTISLAGCNKNKPLLNVCQGSPGPSMFHEPHPLLFNNNKNDTQYGLYLLAISNTKSEQFLLKARSS